jgi:hypothetical protein
VADLHREAGGRYERLLIAGMPAIPLSVAAFMASRLLQPRRNVEAF